MASHDDRIGVPARDEGRARVVDPRGSARATMSPIRVLLVDDSDALRRLLTPVLQANGFAPIHAASAEDAFRAAALDPPDVMVVDHVLPGLSGAELIRLVRGSSVDRLRAVPIVGLSARRENGDRLLAEGAARFLAKPFHDSDLLDAIRGVLSASGLLPPEGCGAP